MVNLLSKHAGKYAFLAVLFAVVSFQAGAQSVSQAPVLVHYEGNVWRTPAEVSPKLAVEHARVANLLAIPGLQETDAATYTAYDQLLTYIGNQYNGANSLIEVAIDGYNNIVAQAPNSPNMKAMHEGVFRMHFDVLMEDLAAPNVPQTQN